MNHNVNAIVHKLPECPECGALPEKPCVAARGLFTPIAPHDIRLRVKAGEVFVIEAEDARALNKLKAVRELAGVIGARRALHLALSTARKGPISSLIEGSRRIRRATRR